MANKFVKLGNIKGKPISEIVKKVGKPNSISAMAGGQLYQWIKTSIFLEAITMAYRLMPMAMLLGTPTNTRSKRSP